MKSRSNTTLEADSLCRPVIRSARGHMPTYMDIHEVRGATAEAVANALQEFRDLDRDTSQIVR